MITGGPGPGVRVGGRYVLGEILGCGATGTVWRAQGPTGPVAVKCLHPDLAGDGAVVERFLAEHALLTGLAHPNLVGIRDLVAEPGVFALVLDLVEGVSARERLEAGPVPPGEAAGIAAGVCRALAAVHKVGIVHRDVKPENVLLARDGTPLLTDFGVAYAVGRRRSTSLGLPVGTAEYVAPELVGGATPTPAADVYAVGVLLYELLTGRPPFRAADPLAVLYRHVHVPPAFPIAAPPALAELVLRCLGKDPAMRPAVAEVADLLAGTTWHRRASGGGAPPVPSAGRPTHPGRGRAPAAGPAPPPVPSRRRRGVAVAVALAAVLGTGVGVAVAGPLPLSGTRGGVGRPAPGEVYRAPTGWICTRPHPVSSRQGATFHSCVLGAGGSIAGRAEARAAAGAAGVGSASPVDLELRWRRWTGARWEPIGAAPCPGALAAGGAQTCVAAPGGHEATFALVASPIDARGAGLGPDLATPAITVAEVP